MKARPRRARLLAPAVLLCAAAGQAQGLREVSEQWGLAFRHHNAGSGERYIVETSVGGVVVFDFDLDGDEDVLFVDGGPLPGYAGEAPRTRLFRNDGGGRFVDRTAAAGIDLTAYGSGGAAADVDGDGDLDLYLTAFGRDALFENLGDGTFAAATRRAGLGNELWGAAAAFADVDRDGDLDLYVSNYVDFSFENHRQCGNKGMEILGYCPPGQYDGLPDVFYENLGDGTFVEATERAGFAGAAHEAGFGAVFGDLDEDGWPDLYVANDTDPNFLFRNRGDGTFEDWSLLSGTSHGDRGDPEAGMGVDFGDVDGDGRLDIVVTNFELETNALYRNGGGLLFTDGRFLANVAEATLLKLAFGVDLADLDNDGDLDLVVANGHVLDNAEVFDGKSEYKQANQLFENDGGGRFRLVEDAFSIRRASRGLASGDLDGDGDLDLVISNSNDRAEVYENRLAPPGSSLLVDLRGRRNRFGVGARVVLELAGRRLPQEILAGSSFLSQNALTLHFGLGGAESAGLFVRWPDGRRQRFRDLPPGRVQLAEPVLRSP